MSFPVASSQKASLSRWGACFDQEGLNTLTPSVFLSTPASAAVGQYNLQLHVLTQHGQKAYMVGRFILLCNPWCRGEETPWSGWYLHLRNRRFLEMF